MSKLPVVSSFESEFAKVYEENFDRLYHFALTFSKSSDLAKDIVSEVFLGLWKNKTRFSEIKQIESYLFISIKNEAIRVISKSQNNIHLQDFESEIKAIDKVNPEELLMEKELMQDIDKVIQSLPDQTQIIWEMARVKRMKYKEIAEEMGLSVSAVRMQLIKATAAVKDVVAAKYFESERSTSSKFGVINLLFAVLVG